MSVRSSFVSVPNTLFRLSKSDTVSSQLSSGISNSRLPSSSLTGVRDSAGIAALIASATCSGVTSRRSASCETVGSCPVSFTQRSRTALIFKLSSFNERLTFTVPPSRNSFLISPKITGIMYYSGNYEISFIQ